MTIPETIARAKELAAKATEGPWFYYASLSPEETGRPNGVCCDVRRDTEEPHGGDYEIPSESIIDELRDEDMEFIAESRTLLPAMANDLESEHNRANKAEAEVERLQKLVEERPHDRSCRWINPQLLSVKEMKSGLYNCDCWKSRFHLPE